MSEENVKIVRRYFQLIDRMLGEYWENPVPLANTRSSTRRSGTYMPMQSGSRLIWRRSVARRRGWLPSPIGSMLLTTGASSSRNLGLRRGSGPGRESQRNSRKGQWPPNRSGHLDCSHREAGEDRGD